MTNKEMLMLAIARAKGFQACDYADESTSPPSPYCVVGQAAALCGVPMEKVAAWPGQTWADLTSATPDLRERSRPIERTRLPTDLDPILEALQGLWDGRRNDLIRGVVGLGAYYRDAHVPVKSGEGAMAHRARALMVMEVLKWAEANPELAAREVNP